MNAKVEPHAEVRAEKPAGSTTPVERSQALRDATRFGTDPGHADAGAESAPPICRSEVERYLRIDRRHRRVRVRRGASRIEDVCTKAKPTGPDLKQINMCSGTTSE